MTNDLQEYSRQMVDYTRRQWNITRIQSKRDKAREESETSVTQGVVTGQESRAATASALQVRARRPSAKLNVDNRLRKTKNLITVVAKAPLSWNE
jgi:hypothetical protein